MSVRPARRALPNLIVRLLASYSAHCLSSFQDRIHVSKTQLKEQPFLAAATSRTHGFTLIELLVVLVILALFSGMVVLSIGDNQQRKLLAEAERVQAIIIAAADEAVYTGNELGLYLTKESYQILRWDRLQSSWLVVATPAFSEYRLPDSFAMEWSIDGFVPPDESDAIKFEFGTEEDYGVEDDEVGVADQEIELNTEGAVKTDRTPQILMLSSAELSVFELEFALREQTMPGSVVRVYSDGFSMPRIRQNVDSIFSGDDDDSF